MKRVMLRGAPQRNQKRYSRQAESSINGEAEAAGKGPYDDYVDLIPSDSIAAFEAITREVSAVSGFPLAIPGCFLHQIYAVLKDKTLVNFEIHEARARGVLRFIETEDLGIFLVREADYRALIDTLISSAEADPAAQAELNVLKRFRKAITGYNQIGISQEELFELMGFKEEDRDVTVSLLRFGFIVFQTHKGDLEQEPSFWFALPNMLVLVREIEGARREIINMIKTAKPYREMLRSKYLRKGKLRASSMSLMYHIRDVIGAGLVVARDTGIEGKASLYLLPDRLTS